MADEYGCLEWQFCHGQAECAEGLVPLPVLISEAERPRMKMSSV